MLEARRAGSNPGGGPLEEHLEAASGAGALTNSFSHRGLKQRSESRRVPLHEAVKLVKERKNGHRGLETPERKQFKTLESESPDPLLPLQGPILKRYLQAPDLSVPQPMLFTRTERREPLEEAMSCGSQ